MFPIFCEGAIGIGVLVLIWLVINMAMNSRQDYIHSKRFEPIIISPTAKQAAVIAHAMGLSIFTVRHVRTTDDLRGMTLDQQNVFSVGACEAETYALTKGACVWRVTDAPIREFREHQRPGFYE